MKFSYDTEALEEEIFGSSRDEGAAEEWDEEEEETLEFPDTPVTVAVTLENGMQTEYTVAGVFLEGEKEYIALETQEGDIHIMELSEGEGDEVRFLTIEEKEEQERVIEAFRYYFERPEMENEREREKNDDRDQDREKD